MKIVFFQCPDLGLKHCDDSFLQCPALDLNTVRTIPWYPTWSETSKHRQLQMSYCTLTSNIVKTPSLISPGDLEHRTVESPNVLPRVWTFWSLSSDCQLGLEIRNIGFPKVRPGIWTLSRFFFHWPPSDLDIVKTLSFKSPPSFEHWSTALRNVLLWLKHRGIDVPKYSITKQRTASLVLFLSS